MKKIPLRRCVVTKEQLPKKELLRIVRDKDGNINVDTTSKANGRGTYIKKDLEVLLSIEADNATVILSPPTKVEVIISDLNEIQIPKTKINSNVLKISVVGLSVALLTVCAWISIPVGAVPITLQMFAVFAIAGLLDLKMGVLSMTSYLLLGAVGVPVFANFKSGVAVLQGATGGYIIGMLISIIIVNLFKYIKIKPFVCLIVGMITGLILCYIFGTIWFYFIFAKTGSSKTIAEILSICVFPFVIPDIIKIVLAAVLVDRLRLPLEKIGYHYNGRSFVTE